MPRKTCPTRSPGLLGLQSRRQSEAAAGELHSGVIYAGAGIPRGGGVIYVPRLFICLLIGKFPAFAYYSSHIVSLDIFLVFAKIYLANLKVNYVKTNTAHLCNSITRSQVQQQGKSL